MRSLTYSYLLCVLGLLSPVAGLHRFYLGKPISGLFYLMTWGFLGIGTLIDLVRMPATVDYLNFRHFYRNSSPLSSPERQILRLASKHGGIITPQMVVMNSNLSLVTAQSELEYLKKSGFCSKDIDEDGADIFTFTGLSAKKPLL